ncbi:hypothetical protein DFH07DRAFT_975582 [Mycena maculata]|uniref:Uncharacterized protein n=1 Tax=Mycena maculata TaxID=230809 RepID=A0AAD7KKA6_9AGAR|nr:hypothetical protein DFH07DRAFT_975582 [Mycena maculata]
MVGWSRFTKASEKLIDIRTRWTSSERFLGPTIEALPQLLVIPVLLFIAGLLDTLFSSVLQISPPPKTILFASGISLLFISAVAVLLCYTLAQRSLNPSGPPFRTTVSRLLRRPSPDGLQNRDFPDTLSEKAPSIYHEVMQETHDDDTLNQAAAALYNIIQSLGVWPRYGGPNPGLLGQERLTFLHLLSPEASIRSNRTAVQVISRIQDSNRIRYSPTDMSELVPVLLQAAKRAPITDLWESSFIRAMAVVANAAVITKHYPPVMSFLSSEYIDNQHLPSDSDPSAEYAVRTKTISSVVEILFTKLSRSLADRPKSMTEDEVVDQVLSPPQGNRRETAVSPAATMNAGKIIAALLYLPLPQNVSVLTLIIRWLVRTTSPFGVIRATQAHVDAITGHDVWPTVLFFVASIAGRVCLTLDSFREHVALAELCISSLVKIADFHQFHPQLPSLVSTAVAALRQAGRERTTPEMTRDLVVVGKFLEDDTWRWSGKQRFAVLAELQSLKEDDRQQPRNFSIPEEIQTPLDEHIVHHI